MDTWVLGIDPGKKGGIALVAGNGLGRVWRMPAVPHVELPKIINEAWDHALRRGVDFVAYVEKVHSMPRDSVRGAFSFGENNGAIKGALGALRIPLELVSPGKWQRNLGCLTGGDKAVSKKRAVELFPNVAVATDGIADALLIGLYGYRQLNKQAEEVST